MLSAIAKRDLEWIEALESSLGSYVRGIALADNPERFVEAALAPLKQRLAEESALCVRLRNKLCEVAGETVGSSVT